MAFSPLEGGSQRRRLGFFFFLSGNADAVIINQWTAHSSCSLDEIGFVFCFFLTFIYLAVSGLSCGIQTLEQRLVEF